MSTCRAGRVAGSRPANTDLRRRFAATFRGSLRKGPAATTFLIASPMAVDSIAPCDLSTLSTPRLAYRAARCLKRRFCVLNRSGGRSRSETAVSIRRDRITAVRSRVGAASPDLEGLRATSRDRPLVPDHLLSKRREMANPTWGLFSRKVLVPKTAASMPKLRVTLKPAPAEGNKLPS